MKIQILSRIDRSVLFEYETEYNNIKFTLEEAVKRNADLRDADLQDADLRGAYLQNANLQNANLQNAYLRNAYLRGAYLQNANLQNADLRNAYLQGTNLRNTIGNMLEIKSLQCDMWNVVYTKETMCIGCQCHLIKDWFEFTDEQISNMDKNALLWWKEWKPILKQIIDISPAR